jgi:uncharacterized iron-regulated membrane protein
MQAGLRGMKTRHTLRRLHIWLGWLVAAPFLLWTVSGLVMVVKPIEEVRGEGLLLEAPLLAPGTPLTPPALPMVASGSPMAGRAGCCPR